MNAYLFTGVTTRSQVRPIPGRRDAGGTIQTWDACASQIVLGDSPEEAQTKFEIWLRTMPEGENPVEVILRKIAAAQFIDQWFTESGGAPLNWPEILKRAESQLQSTPMDDFEQGYWVDVDRVVRPEKLSFSAGTLQSEVPEDIRSGLNWLSDRKFLFVLSVLSPPAPQVEPVDEPETDNPDSDESLDELTEKSASISVGELYATFPQALDKEAAALIQARNSVVAAWLWRRYALNTRLAVNAIRIDPWCGAIGLDGTG
ncbi:MAG TPA: hypothetical protein VMJ12_09030 [Candidatus Acidoferrales bacterium]|nr:hypothetical protein [Candidatus Acidoferrales bacterium]